jgi:hypothetical protein
MSAPSRRDSAGRMRERGAVRDMRILARCPDTGACASTLRCLAVMMRSDTMRETGLARKGLLGRVAYSVTVCRRVSYW